MPTERAFQWDDLRVFLATMRAASLRKAATELGVSRQTAARRLGELEQRLGVLLFERRTDGLHATPQAAELLPVAEDAERAMAAVARTADALDSALRGPLRATMPGPVATDLLMEDLIAFTRAYPQVDLHISGSIQLEDLAKRQADVAIRFMPFGSPPSFDLAGRKVGVAHSAIYGEGDCWIGQPGLPESFYATTDFADVPLRGSISDGEVLRTACAQGMGLAFLPCFMADGVCERRSEPVPAFDIWVVVHHDLRRTPRFRVFRDAMVDALRDKRERLEGR